MIPTYTTATNSDPDRVYNYFLVDEAKLDIWNHREGPNQDALTQQGLDEGWLVAISLDEYLANH